MSRETMDHVVTSNFGPSLDADVNPNDIEYSRIMRRFVIEGGEDVGPGAPVSAFNSSI
jgi:hypothetical protein